MMTILYLLGAFWAMAGSAVVVAATLSDFRACLRFMDGIQCNGKRLQHGGPFGSAWELNGGMSEIRACHNQCKPLLVTSRPRQMASRVATPDAWTCEILVV